MYSTTYNTEMVFADALLHFPSLISDLHLLSISLQYSTTMGCTEYLAQFAQNIISTQMSMKTTFDPCLPRIIRKPVA